MLKMKNKLPAAPYLVWMIVFILVPLIMVAYFAFTDKDGHFTLDYVSNVAQYTPIFVRSIWLALISTVICLLIAYPLAYILIGMNTNIQSTMLMIVMLPMWMNFLLRTYAWMALLGNNGLINALLGLVGLGPFKMLNTEGAVVLGMVYNYLPFMILPLHTVLSSIDKNYIEAAVDLGADKFQVFAKTILPLSVPGILSGITMVFIPTISTFAISQLLSDSTVFLFGDSIQMKFDQGLYGVGSVMSLVMIILVLVSNFLMNRFSKTSATGGRNLW